MLACLQSVCACVCVYVCLRVCVCVCVCVWACELLSAQGIGKGNRERGGAVAVYDACKVIQGWFNCLMTSHLLLLLLLCNPTTLQLPYQQNLSSQHQQNRLVVALFVRACVRAYLNSSRAHNRVRVVVGCVVLQLSELQLSSHPLAAISPHLSLIPTFLTCVAWLYSK